MDEGRGIDCYEIVLPEPAEGFAKALLEECLPTESGVLRENTGRFGFGNSLKLLTAFSRSAIRTEAVAFPAWENAALLTEGRCAVLRLIALLALLLPAVIVCILLVRCILLARGKLRGKGRTVTERVRDRVEERRARRMGKDG